MNVRMYDDDDNDVVDVVNDVANGGNGTMC